ncbi:MAG: hypothetical protein P4L92_22310 [Rudaea sp.]|nr:hypothetical protein [Rudaea sp.]
MRSIRVTETKVLGYSIERVDVYDDVGLLRSTRHEVLCPQTGAVVGSHTSRREAERFVIALELNGSAATGHSRQGLAA